ncbi:MAG TPA: biopolymer transporter ExbD [Pirellulales bacterium]|nr:biopolymer transporter ExbD [Pirellulales bacterium]
MRLPPSEAESDGPNMTPVIDVVFLLLIFFLCATRFDQEEREVSAVLPEVVESQPLSMPPEELVINVTRAGEYIVVGEKVSEDQVVALLRQAALKNPGTASVMIRSDEGAAWKFGVRVMGFCNQANITNYRVGVIPGK